MKALKKSIIPLLLCGIIVSSCWYTLYSHYTSPTHSDYIGMIERKLLDIRFRLRGKRPVESKVGILAIDERTLQKFGSWPFSRGFYAPALDNLRKLGVRIIGFDAIYAEAESAKISDVKRLISDLSRAKEFSNRALRKKVGNAVSTLQRFRKNAPGDLAFARSIENFEDVVLGYFYYLHQAEVKLAGLEKRPFQGLDLMEGSEISAVILPENLELTDYKQVTAAGLVSNIPVLSESGMHHAFFSNESDSDAINRWVTLVKVLDGRLMPSLALKVAAETLDAEVLVEFDEVGVKTLELIGRETEESIGQIPLDPFGQGRVLANHVGPSRSFPHFSLADAYSNTFSKKERKALKGAVLLVGMTAIGINDQRANPFDAALDGVENHAAVLDSILTDNHMQRPRNIFNLELTILLVLGLIFSPLIIFAPAWFAGLATTLFVVGYYYFDHYYWFSKGIWAYVGMPTIEILSLFVVVTLYKYITEEQEKKQIRGAFSLYLSPEVISEVLDNPDALQLGGQKKELTVFFSDVRSFTTISEGLSPEHLCEYMNAYFTPMTDIILKSRGVLDKYIGDAIMAFWGAPVVLPDQADRAAFASVRMLKALDRLQREFKERGFPKCEIGIGLNTGQMSVGNMGSDERFCYTVMGDSVNLGARLEGLTKDYGVKILMSEFTVAKLRSKEHFYRELDLIRVKGKNEPITVYELIRPDYMAKATEIRDLIGEFGLSREAYLKQNWDVARKHLQACLDLKPGDGPATLFMKRVEEFVANPPGDDWNGVYTFTHK